MPGFEGLLAGRTLIDRYRIEEVIGRGGFAAVYRATDERLGRPVAVKVITFSATNPETREEVQKRFRREARAIASLHHPNVVTLYDFGTDPALGLDFFVMELLRGEDLSHRLARPAPIPPRIALRMLRDAASGVNAGHQAGLIHRDIKPGNIFLARRDRPGRFRVCVLDFGIARFALAEEATQLTRAGGVLLSPAYASPEQLRGETRVTPASDVFSLGVIGYEMLTRERPFAGNRLQSPPGAHPTPVPLRDRNPEVPAEVAEAIHRALAEDPAERFPDAGVFAEALAAAGAVPEGALAEPPPSGQVIVPPPTRPPEPPPPPPPAEEEVPTVRHSPARGERPRRPSAVAAARARARRVPGRAAALGLLAAGAAVAGWLALSAPGERPALRSAPAGREAPAPTAGEPADTGPAVPPSSPGDARVGSTSPGPARPASGAGADPPPRPRAGGLTPTGSTAPPRTAASPPGAPVPQPASPPAPAARPSAPREAGPARLNREGEALFERNEIPEAVERFRAAVASAPNSAHYRNNLGWALFQLGEVDAAGRELEETLRLDPRRAIAYANLGEVRAAQGDTAAAIAAYERFLELNTDPRRERIARGKLRRLHGEEPGASP